ncbi:MAG: carbonic anhydrase [Acidimicrobiia bacterium]
MTTTPSQPTAAEALALLQEGNARFVSGKCHAGPRAFADVGDLSPSQAPIATILGCADSRVSPELIFDAGLGELFVVRVAGNVLSPEVAGSLQYAVAYLHTPLIVVLGHTKCGAIRAALEQRNAGATFLSHVALLAEALEPSLERIPVDADPEAVLDTAVQENVERTVARLATSNEGQMLAASGANTVGAVYDLATGRVQFSEPLG